MCTSRLVPSIYLIFSFLHQKEDCIAFKSQAGGDSSAEQQVPSLNVYAESEL